MSAIYMNNATTSFPKPVEMAEGFSKFCERMNALGGRGGGQAAREAGLVFNTARSKTAKFFGASYEEGVIFTRGTTEAINLVLKGFLRSGDRVFISPMEHNAVVRPLNRLMQERGIEFHALPANEIGKVDWGKSAQLARQIGEPKLIVLIHISSVNSVVQDVHAAKRCFPSVPLLLDAAQSAGVIPIDIDAMGIDFMACSAHKGLYGPTGVGVCYVSPRYELTPLVDGATRLCAGGTVPPVVRPDMFEAGTPNLHGVSAYLGSLEWLCKNGLTGSHKTQMAVLLTSLLEGVQGVNILSPTDSSQTFVCLTLDNVLPIDAMNRLLEEHNIVCRAGVLCAELAQKHLKTFPNGVIRLSPGHTTTEQDIETVARVISSINTRSGSERRE